MTEQTINELTNFFQQFKNVGTKLPAQSNLTFDKARDCFFNNMHERGLADQTMLFYKKKLSTFRKFLVQIKKVEFLETVTTDELKYYFETKYSKNKVGYYNCHMRALRAFFNYLEKDGYLLANPARCLQLKKQHKEKLDYFTIDQVRKMVTSFDLRYKSELRNLLLTLILLDTGVRNSELVRIKLEDINYNDRSIYIYATKTNTFRTVYYSKETERILNIYRREVLKGAEKGPLLIKFSAQSNEPLVGVSITTEMVYGILSRRANKVFDGKVRMNPHKFRHTFATHFIINGGDPFSLRDLLGHTNIETTKIYVDMSPKDLKTKHTQHSIIANIENNRQAYDYHKEK